MSEVAMLMVKALVLGVIVTFVLGFVFIKIVSRHTETAVTRLNRETEQVRTKQIELNDKIKQAKEELDTRRKEADALVAKMSEDAESKAKAEREKIISKARQDAEEIINKAHATKGAVRQELEKEMKLKAVDYAAILMKEFLTVKSIGILDENIIAEFLTNLEQTDFTIVSADIDTAEIVTARDMTEQIIKRLKDILKAKLDRDINIAASVDAGIIGGMLLKFGSLSLDGSLRSVLLNSSETTKDKLEKGMI